MPKSLKDKHKDRPWFDRDGDLWFWDGDKEEWVVVYYTGVYRGAVDDGDAGPEYGPYSLAVPKID